MAGTDGHAKEYFSNPVNAADLFTNTLFQRLFRVDPSMLTRMDPTEVQTDVLQMAGGPEVVALQRYDDVLYQLNLPKGGLLSSDESRRLSELAKLLCKAMEEPEEADQTCEDGDQSSIEEKQDSADRRQISGDAGEVPESAEPGTDAGQDHEAAEGSASGQEKIDFEDLFSDSKNLFRELACMILPFLLMFLPEAMEREFETIKPRKCKTALLKNVMSAMKKAIETAFLSALKEMARQLDQDISQMHIAIISLENMGQVRFDTVFRVMTRTSMRYNAQIEAARMKEFQNAVTQYNIRKENAKKRNMAFLEKQPVFRKYMKASDKLFPVIPIVVSLVPSTKWTASKDIFGTLGELNPLFLMFTSNFRYYLVNAVGMDDKDFEKFDTDLGLVLAVLKYAKVDGGVNKIRDFENKLKKLSPAGAELICAATGMTLTEIQAKFPSYAKDTEEGGTPMCEFWTDLFNQIEESDEMLLSGVLTVMKNQSCDAEQAMSYLGYKEKNRPRIRKLLKKVGVSAGAAF